MSKDRHSSNFLIRALLGIPGMRRRIAFAMAHSHLSDLHLRMPLEGGLCAPLDHRDAFIAFSETFLSGEYGDLFSRLPLPGRWLDIGSHRGYFSLWLACERLRRGMSGAGQALLIDADPRALGWFNNLREANPALGGFQFMHAADASPESGDKVEFALREGMTSARPADMPLACDSLVSVPILKTAAVLEKIAAPYDLIKVDVEGAEFTLLETMGDLLAQTQYLVVEWHGRGNGVEAEGRLIKDAAALGFGAPEKLRPDRVAPDGPDAYVAGTHLYHRVRKA